MNRPCSTPAAELRRLLAGQRIHRRTALRLAASTALGLALPGALAACGTNTEKAGDKTDYALDIGGTSPPGGDLLALITARAVARAMNPSFFDTAPENQPQQQFASDTAVTNSFNPITNRYALVNNLVVVAPLSPAYEPIAAKAVEHGVLIVSYPTPMLHQTAAILVDLAQGAAILAARAAAWAGTELGGRGSVLLVLPTPGDSGLNPYFGYGPSVEQAFRATLAREAPGLTVAAAVQSSFSADGAVTIAPALSAYPEVRIVLVWDDATALIAAQGLRNRHPGAGRESLFVGALGAPCLTSRGTAAAPGTITELQTDGVLQVIVAARMRDLANAIVDLPKALLSGSRPGNVELALQTLTPHSAALSSYSHDYPAVPDPAATGDLNQAADSD
jgi:ABC-type sugar transport system substrate-binding protein